MSTGTSTPTSTPATDRPTLWSNPDFAKLWVARTVSDFGSMVTGVALPLTAVVVLSASPGQMGLLTAVGELPVLAVGLLAGAWVDRLRRRPVLIATDLARALLLTTIPVAFILGMLAMWQLYVVAALAGTLTIFFDVASQSYLPSLVGRDDLVEGNSRLSASNSVAEVSAPPTGGVLVQVLTAPLAILVDAFSFLASAVLIALIRKPEPRPEVHEHPDIRRDIVEGLHTVLGNPVLRALTGRETMASFFGNFIGVSYNLFVIRELGLSPTVLGVLIGAGGAGALVGALIAGRVTARFRPGVLLMGIALFTGVFCYVIPLTAGPPPVAAGILLANQFIGDIAWALYFIQSVSLRQSLVPDRLLGRASASTRFIVGGIGPVGALIAGVLGEAIGLRGTLALGATGLLLSALWFLPEAVRKL